MRAPGKAIIPRAFAIAVGLTLAASHSAIAVIGLPPVLVANRSNSDLVLSYPSTSPNFYSVQTSPDLLLWSTLPGTPGDGSVDSVTMSNALLGSATFYRLSIQQPLSLSLPQGDASAVLGHDCSGIKEQVYVTGFDPAFGYIIGQVDLSTTCSGSGRDPRPTTYNGAASVMWDLGGNVISYGPLSNAVPISANFLATDAFGNAIYNVYNGRASAYLVVPLPGSPIVTTAAQSNDQFNISWMLNGANPISVTSSTITATPSDPTAASVLTTIVPGAATNGTILPLQPSTTYQITVINVTISGSSPPSAPVTLTTPAPTIVPGAPINVTNVWSNPDGGDLTIDTIIVNWQPGSSGNSPIDQYQVSITPNDGSGTLTQTVLSPTLTTYFNVSPQPSWTITVQAHNAAGWGPWSGAVHLGGL